jgi:acetolactate synthase regulatory subunit
MNPSEELLGLAADLELEGVEYALCGGFVVAIHGDPPFTKEPRFPKEIDLLAQARDLERVRIVFRKRGFTLIGMPMLLGAGTSSERELVRLTRADGSDPLTIALLHGGDRLARVWQCRTRIGWRGREIQVVSLEGLICMTQLSDRAQGPSDISALARHPNRQGPRI